MSPLLVAGGAALAWLLAACGLPVPLLPSTVLFALAAFAVTLAALLCALDANARLLHARDEPAGNCRLFQLDRLLNLVGAGQVPRLVQPSSSGGVSRLSSPFLTRRVRPGHQRSLSACLGQLHSQCASSSTGLAGSASSLFDQTGDSYSGHPRIDQELRELLNLILRDYVYSWYSPFSANHEFVGELRTLLQVRKKFRLAEKCFLHWKEKKLLKNNSD